MSSLAATQADGYYLPPEYYESGSTSKNQWYRKQQQQQQKQKNGHQNNTTKSSSSSSTDTFPTVRFELVDPCVCLKCHARIGKGTRFNAVKRPTDETYFSTPIWEFTMTCRRCATQPAAQFIIRTDPKHQGFCYGGYLRKQERSWDANQVGGISVEDKEHKDNDGVHALSTSSSSLSSPVDALCRRANGLRAAVAERQELEQLIQLNDQTWGKDVSGNATIRATFRRDRQVRKRLHQQAQKQGWKETLTFVESTMEDECQAKGMVFGNGRKNEQQRWNAVRTASIFSPTTTKKPRHETAAPDTIPSAYVRASSSSSPDMVSSSNSLGSNGCAPNVAVASPDAMASSSNSSTRRPAASTLPPDDSQTQQHDNNPPKRRIVLTTAVGGKKKGLVVAVQPNAATSLQQQQQQQEQSSSIGALSSIAEGYASSSSSDDEWFHEKRRGFG